MNTDKHGCEKALTRISRIDTKGTGWFAKFAKFASSFPAFIRVHSCSSVVSTESFRLMGCDQAPKVAQAVIGAWRLELPWSLDVGAWSFFSYSALADRNLIAASVRERTWSL